MGGRGFGGGGTRYTCCLTSIETIRLIRDMEKGEGVLEGRGKNINNYMPNAILSPPE